MYEQYAHLVELDAAVKASPQLQSVLGNGYTIAPDIVVSRAPVDDVEINADELVVDHTIATHTPMRAVNQGKRLSTRWSHASGRSAATVRRTHALKH